MSKKYEMQAICVMKNGDANVLQMQKLLKPIPKRGEALVRLKTAGLNFIDIYMRQGNPVIPVPLPFIPGLEGVQEQSLASLKQQISSLEQQIKLLERKPSKHIRLSTKQKRQKNL